MAATTQPKPQNDAYTGILFISLLALIGACVLLYMDYSQYGDRVPPKSGDLKTPEKSIERGSITTTIPPQVPAPEPKKAENPPTMKAPPLKPRDSEVTSIKPKIQAPPIAPAPIPTLDLPGVPPLPVPGTEEGKVVPAKFEALAPVKPILDVTPKTVSKPVDPMKDMETIKPAAPESVKPTVPVSLNDGPPVVRPFVPEK